jgi:hypothetical protein
MAASLADPGPASKARFKLLRGRSGAAAALAAARIIVRDDVADFPRNTLTF